MRAGGSVAAWWWIWMTGGEIHHAAFMTMNRRRHGGVAAKAASGVAAYQAKWLAKQKKQSNWATWTRRKLSVAASENGYGARRLKRGGGVASTARRIKRR